MKDDLYASHLPVLVKMIERTKGPILELGMGFSTTLFHLMCKQKKRIVVSYENDLEWYKKFEGYDCDFHSIRFIEDWDALPEDFKYWGLVFIDQRPARRRRTDALKYKDIANFIILHDTEPEQDKFFGYKKIYPEFKYVYQYTEARPHTAVLSNYYDVSTYEL